MDDIRSSPHSFILQDAPEETPKYPRVPQGRKRINLPAYYPKYEPEFYDTVQKCAEYIDKLPRVEKKIYYTKELSKVFIVRHRGAVMKLFRDIINELHRKEGDYRG